MDSEPDWKLSGQFLLIFAKHTENDAEIAVIQCEFIPQSGSGWRSGTASI